jgi:glucose/arabinose dehydrogenase
VTCGLRRSFATDPAFSWRWAVAPAGIGFLRGRALGPQYEGDLFVAAARTTLEGGYLFRFNLTGNRRKIGVDDPRLADRVADNNAKFDITESESLLAGRNFGIAPDVQTGPNGHLYVVSLSNGAVYEIFRR